MTQEEQQILFKQMVDPNVETIGDVSDGYHTFNSLYNQRLYLWAALVKAYKDKAWKTRRHSDGKPCFDGNWFLVGITTPAGDYTYHYELKDWNLFDCKVIDRAPEFDGHTDADVTRVLTLKPCGHQWIDAAKKTPKCYDEENDESDDYYVVDRDDVKYIASYNLLDKVWRDDYGHIIHVAYWNTMPLPQPPTGKED